MSMKKGEWSLAFTFYNLKTYKNQWELPCRVR